LLGPALLVKGRRGGLVTNPAWRIYRDAIAAHRMLAREFGLTPSARSEIEAAPLLEPGGGAPPEGEPLQE